ncbi:MAG: helix-turn-helix domain-containing protein [Armatimonadetes bacterium]|nr:helix-turn-helix domain-containing protein [Armatimonadota bacterium]
MESSRHVYERRLNAVIDHIESHFDQALPLETLADLAHFSPFHFHRIFKEYTGETPSVFVRRLRLQKALTQMETPSRPTLTDIALDCGFAQSSDFTRAFREVYGYPPSQHRKGRAGEDSKIRQDILANRGYGSTGSKESGDHFVVRVEELPAIRFAYVRVIGGFQPDRLLSGLDRLLTWGRSKGIYPGARLATISPDNPEFVPVSRYRLDLCMEVPSGFAETDELSYATVASQRCAMLHCHGDIHKVHRGWTHLFAHWLPDSGYEPTDAPSMEIFRNSDDSQGWSILDLDCCVPVRPLRKES